MTGRRKICNVRKNDGYVLSVVQGKKRVLKVQVKRNRESHVFTRKQLKKLEKGQRYEVTLAAKGTYLHRDSKPARIKAVMIRR